MTLLRLRYRLIVLTYGMSGPCSTFFLTLESAKLMSQLHRSLKRGGHPIIATFAQAGPLQCSGLPAARDIPDSLRSELGNGFSLIEHANEEHLTPVGKIQNFLCCLFQRL